MPVWSIERLFLANFDHKLAYHTLLVCLAVAAAMFHLVKAGVVAALREKSFGYGAGFAVILIIILPFSCLCDDKIIRERLFEP
jgi:hypothetical protein